MEEDSDVGNYADPVEPAAACALDLAEDDPMEEDSDVGNYADPWDEPEEDGAWNEPSVEARWVI